MQKIIYLFKKSLSDLYKNPIVVLPTFILLVIFAILSGLALDFTNAFNSSSSQMVFIIISSLIAYSIISFLFSSLIGLSGDIIRGKKKNIFIYGKKFWLKNLLIIILILVVRYIVNVSSIFLGVKIGTFLNLSLQPAKILFSLIYAIGLLGIIIFLTFSSFYLVLKNLSIIQSVKSSFSLVRKIGKRLWSMLLRKIL